MQVHSIGFNSGAAGANALEEKDAEGLECDDPWDRAEKLGK
jgi:hypothetical protein